MDSKAKRIFQLEWETKYPMLLDKDIKRFRKDLEKTIAKRNRKFK